MQLSEVERQPTAARRYLERYVNDGSPSGFTDRYTSSKETQPFGPTPSFPLFAGTLPPECVEDHGTIPGWLLPGEIPLHPDMASVPLVVTNFPTIYETPHHVTPTASVRTVEVLNETHGGFIKLTYNRLLGRVNRQISRSHALSALEITEILDGAANANTLPFLFGYLREKGARVAHLKAPNGSTYEWGTVFRELNPRPSRATDILLPAFALFAADREQPSDPPLIRQLMARQTVPPGEYLFSNVLAPIVSCYFEMILGHALQFECNAQNLLLGFDSTGGITEVVFRDFESVDKDVSVAEELRLGVVFTVSPFKCVHRDQCNYAIKHSFMYDFKLGTYVLSPLIATLGSLESRREAEERVRKLAMGYVQRLPYGFFPTDGLWYSYDNVVVDKTKKRPYVAHQDPLYR